MILHDIWNINLIRNPQKIALISGADQITYYEAFCRVNQYANLIEDFHALEGNRIGILLRNSPEFLYAYFAATATSNIAVPINDKLKGHEIEYILNNAQVSCLITAAEFLPLINEIRSRLPAVTRIITIDDHNGDSAIIRASDYLAKLPPYFTPRFYPTPQRVAVFIYTSGTTGFPKAAIITHDNLLSNVATVRQLYGLTQDDVFACVLPMWHNYSITDCCLLPLLLGSTIVIGQDLSTGQTLELIKKHGITFLATVPSQLNEMAYWEQDFDTKSLRMVQTGGAALPPEIRAKFERKYGLPIIEGYGLSEASATVTVNPMEGPYKTGSVGKVLPNQQIRIVDDRKQDLPPDTTGEIIVKGPNIMRGYYNLPEASAATLTNGWLHTGDLGYLDRDGYLFITGRKKEMINVGGFNVYPREIENVLYMLDGIMDVCIIKTWDPTFGEAVKALIVKKPDSKIHEAAIIMHCRENLAEYKVPRQIEFRSSLPKTGSGKIIRDVLQKEEDSKTKPINEIISSASQIASTSTAAHSSNE